MVTRTFLRVKIITSVVIITACQICSAQPDPQGCIPPFPTDTIIIKPAQADYCYGDTLQIAHHNIAGYASCRWDNGSFDDATTYVLSGSYISIQCVDTSGIDDCPVLDTFFFNLVSPETQEICIVGVDSATGENIIVWDKSASAAIDSFKIYRESVAGGQYELVAAVPYSDFSTFVDLSSSPNQQADRYKISAVGACGESALSQVHKTIHLTANVGTSGESNLLWSEYEGLSFSTYRIYRGTSASHLQLIDSIQSTLTSYSDINPPPGASYYQIEVLNLNGCSPAKKSQYNSSKSNIAITNPTGTNLKKEKIDAFEVYPNPSTGRIQIKNVRDAVSATVRIFNSPGQEIVNTRYDFSQTEVLTLDLAKNQPGYYILEIISANIIIRKNLVLK